MTGAEFRRSFEELVEFADEELGLPVLVYPGRVMDRHRPGQVGAHVVSGELEMIVLSSGLKDRRHRLYVFLHELGHAIEWSSFSEGLRRDMMAVSAAVDVCVRNRLRLVPEAVRFNLDRERAADRIAEALMRELCVPLDDRLFRRFARAGLDAARQQLLEVGR